MAPVNLTHVRQISGIKQILFRCFIRRNHSFHDLKIHSSIIKKLREYGIKSPTEIQVQTLQDLQTAKNIVVNSETGSGKTLAYALLIAQRLINLKKVCKELPSPFALVLVPNAHLGHQVSEVFQSLLSLKTCFASEASPLFLLKTDVVVSTPLFLSTYPLSVLNNTQVVVVDEADIQISNKVGKTGKKDPLFCLIKHLIQVENFKPPMVILETSDIFSLSSAKPIYKHNVKADENFSKRQFLFVGATMPDSFNQKSKTALPYIRSWLPDIQVVQGEHAHKVVPTTDMEFIDVLEGNKWKHLVEYISSQYSDLSLPCKVLVFVNKVETAISLHKKLTLNNSFDSKIEDDSKFSSLFALFQEIWHNKISLLYSKINSQTKEEIFSQIMFSNRVIVITTDVVSRGFDFPNLDLVVQYDFATNVIDILHRAGRTARMGKKGRVVNFITDQDKELSTAVQDLMLQNKPLDSLFSRHRSLSRRKQRSLNQEIVNKDCTLENGCNG